MSKEALRFMALNNEERIKTHFYLYDDNSRKKRDASIFDLIEGDDEPQQTKGLAYIFSKYKKFLIDFLNIEKVKSKIQLKAKDFNIEKIDSIEVSAEKFSNTRDRADIVIKLMGKNTVSLAIIIEAKSIKAKVNQNDLSDQIKNKYLDDSFDDLKNIKKIGIVLTKYRQNIPDIICITWDDIIYLLDNFCEKNKYKYTDALIYQYFVFLTKIGGSMKFYEKEVVSIPAGDSTSGSMELIKKYMVYACPASQRNTKVKKSLYITFRKGGEGKGEMSTLYKLVDTIVFNPDDSNELDRLKKSDLSSDVIERIMGYIKEEKRGKSTDYQYFIFSLDENIELPKKPKPPRNNLGFWYYKLKDLLENEVVEVDPEAL
jgi:hypothetical protein